MSHQPYHPSSSQPSYCGRSGRDGGNIKKGIDRAEGTWGERGDFYYHRCFKLTAPPLAHQTRLLECPALSTHLSSPLCHPSVPPYTSLSLSQLNLSAANPSLPPQNSFIPTFAPLPFPPSLSMGSRCIWRKWGEEERRGGTESVVQAFGCKGECTWMGRLPGHAVRGYCPACQQPLSFNGARISSF